jgi:O-antigen/teichoic acid export membrane protein
MRGADVLRRLLGETAVYGLGTAAQSALTLLALPVYTRVLGPEDYGVFALLLGAAYMGEILFRTGVHFAFATLAGHETDPEAGRRLARTAWTLLLLQATALLLVLFPAAPALARLVTGSPDHAYGVRLILVHLFLLTPQGVYLFLLRTERRPKPLVALNLGQLALSWGGGLALVAGMGRGVAGAFEGQLAGSLLFGLPSAVVLVRRLGLGIDPERRRGLYALGVSYAASHLATIALAYSGRWLLLAFTTLRAVALYDVAYKIGMALTLLIAPFSMAWTTGLFDVARSERPRERFATVLKGLLAALTSAGVALCALAPEAVRLLGGATYAEAVEIVPVVVSGFVLLGMHAFLAMGPALKRSSREGLAATTASLLASVASGVVLVPRFGVKGAAAASLLSSLVLAAVMYRGSQRCYPMDFPWGALLRMGALYAMAAGAAAAAGSAALSWRLLLALSFPILLLLVRVFEPHEREALRRLPQDLLSRRAEAA